MAKLIIDAGFDYDFTLYALVTHLRDYRLCWFLNKEAGFGFERRNDLAISVPKRRKSLYFPVFSYHEELDKVIYYLISNGANRDRLIPELKDADYFFIVKGNVTTGMHEAFTNVFHAIQPVQTFFKVDPFQLKSKQNLIFDDSDI